jgi:hypothetical protein
MLSRLVRQRFLTLAVRTAGLLVFLWILLVFRQIPTPLAAQDPADRDRQAFQARSIGVTLLENYPDAVDDASRAAMRKSIADYDRTWAAVAQLYNDRPLLPPERVHEGLAQADQRFRDSADQMASALGGLPGVLNVGGSVPVPGESISMPFETSALLVRRQTGTGTLHFLRRRVDLGSGGLIRIDTAVPGDFYCLLELFNPPRVSSRPELELVSGSNVLGKLDLTITVAPRYPLQVKIVDGEGHATEAAVGLYSAGKRLVIPETALDFSAGGYYYQPVRYREGGNTRYWPGGEDFARCFFVRGGYTIELPAGTYRLIATKGPEFLPIDRSITIAPGRPNEEKISLRRWIDMSARGWYSGDTHLHYARASQEADRRLWLWTQAEDLRVSNILRMGDGQETYFEQYAFGEHGRFVRPNFVFVPGQEDPRTAVMGHAIGLNLPRPIRDLKRGYYVYGYLFDDAHKQGGLAGYAHVTTYPRSSGVYRDMTINIPRNKSDFEEICEFGQVDTEIYYEFLNLGFRMTATGGSDVPWGGTAGDSRVYVLGGSRLDTNQWFYQLKKGHTFVTAGPMLEFNISGRLPGDDIRAAHGEKLRVHAKAMAGSEVVRLERLEIVANGEVIRLAKPLEKSAVLDFELPADGSMWIAARATSVSTAGLRTTSAHTTPIYVTVNGKPHWKQDAVPALLDKRLGTLDELDKLIDQEGAEIKPNRAPVWENTDSFRRGAEQLRQEVREAREIYRRLRSEWEAGAPSKQ